MVKAIFVYLFLEYALDIVNWGVISYLPNSLFVDLKYTDIKFEKIWS